jgi:hypothetical protein
MKSAFRELEAFELDLVSGGGDDDTEWDPPTPPDPPPYDPPETPEDPWGEGGAGNVDTRGVNELLSLNPSLSDITADHVFVGNANGSLILADYNLDGVYDRAWTSTSGGWVSTTDGQSWSTNPSDPDSDPNAAIAHWVSG